MVKLHTIDDGRLESDWLFDVNPQMNHEVCGSDSITESQHELSVNKIKANGKRCHTLRYASHKKLLGNGA